MTEAFDEDSMLFRTPLKNECFLGCIFLEPSLRGSGLGAEVWQAVEAMYPDVLTWRTETPLFSGRNLNYYINKLGFSAVRITDVMDPDKAQVQFVKHNFP